MSLTPVLEQPVAPPEPSIKEYLEVLRRRKTIFFHVFLLVLLVGIIATALSKPIYQTTAKLLVPPTKSAVSLVDATNPISSLLAASQPDSLATQTEVLQSAPFQAEARERAAIRNVPGIAPPFARVEALAQSNIIAITAEGGSAEAAAKLANAMVDLHLERTDALETAGLQKTMEFVRKEREAAARELDDAARRLLAFRRDHRVATLTAEQEEATREYVTLQGAVQAAASNIASAEAEIADLRARLAREPVDMVQESAKTNPRRAMLEEKVNALKVERAELLHDFQPDSQRVTALDERIASLTGQMAAETETVTVRTHAPNPARLPLQENLFKREADLQGYVAAHNAARAQFESRKQVVDNLGPWEVQHSRLTHARDAAQNAANMLSERLRDLEIRSKARVQMARVIQRAPIPTSPIRPRKATNLAFSALLALCVAAGVAFLQEQFDDHVRSPEEIERITGLPTMGHVPLLPAQGPHIVADLPANSHVAEAYRGLRSGIGFAGIDAPIRRLMVTSAAKGEGKTVTSVNLAISMAMDGKRVVLVDADLRRPNVHKVLDLPAAPGLSEVLAGMKGLEDALQETGIPNLRALCAGPLPPTPAELLGSAAVDGLLARLEEEADVAIFDTPPCMPVTDPLLLAGRVDGVLIVLNAAETRKGAFKRAVELLSRAHGRILGVVLNRISPEHGGAYYYHYYHYGDGYYSDEGGRRASHRGNGRERRIAHRNGAVVAAREGEELD
jgi:capsular exopolysaccharide synthesis family protein